MAIMHAASACAFAAQLAKLRAGRHFEHMHPPGRPTTARSKKLHLSWEPRTCLTNSSSVSVTRSFVPLLEAGKLEITRSKLGLEH